MPYIAPEVITEAKRMDLLTYLREYEPGELVMAEKRRDNKGRVLRAGESQRSDGKYEYKYADSNSERHSVYSWKLVATDKVPEGKQGGTSLRDMEKQIQKDLEDNLLIYQTRKMALNSFWDQYIELKKEL